MQIVPAAVQRVPHAPQLLLSPPRFVSHPFAATPSQLPNPALHEPSAHAPAVHVALALSKPQVIPHAPQVCGLERSASQPFAGLPSQSAKPARHNVHVKSGAHARFAPTLAQSASVQHWWQPDAPQHVVPDPHAECVHAPPAQTSFVHASPSLQSVFAQQVAHAPPPQSRIPVAQAQAPAVQTCDPGQATPHEPQFAPLVRVSISHPSDGSLLQSAKPALHWIPHTPAAHTAVVDPAGAVALTVHVVPHAPQFETDVCVSTHELPHNVSPPAQPVLHPALPQTGDSGGQTVSHMPQCMGSVADVLQSNVAPHERNPGLHWHAPAMQTAFVPQRLRHEPQFAGSLDVSTSHPFDAIPSQSSNPGRHVHMPITHP
jgi:hypothetical protein